MHIVITGASSGIGAAIAAELAQKPDARLTLVARRADKLEELAAALSVPTHLEARDLSEYPLSTDWLGSAESQHGPVEVLVNNAGVQLIEKTPEMSCDAGERLLFLNLFTPMRLMRAVLPAMVERGSGHIVNIASVAGFAPTPGMTYYNASKAGIGAASEALRGELLGTGVHVLTVYPGIIADTEMFERGMDSYEDSRLVRLQPQGSPTILARLVRRGIERKKTRVIYPRMNVLARNLPSTTRWLMDRFTPEVKG